VPQPSVSPQANEASVRQLIANGKSRTALESAKAFHKAQNTKASESLLIDAYVARIESLLEQNMTTEATALKALVAERFPAARERLAALGGDLAGLVQPLNDPALDAERRAAIERRIQTEVTDLAALADCAALPKEHGLRQAAGALNRALGAVTSGPVGDDQIALPEVSHRSPLAPWKILIRAIASFHRGEDDACLKYLEAIRPESVPARLVPAMRAMLGQKSAEPLKPAEAALVARTTVNLDDLRSVLAKIDREFALGGNEGRLFKTVREAVRECQRSAPDRLNELKHLLGVRGMASGLDTERMVAALDGLPRRNASYFRMLARTLEGMNSPDTTIEACEAWNDFGEAAVREGLFGAESLEMAALYLHMAEILEELPRAFLKEARRFAHEDAWFCYPEKLYERACALDPQREAFSKWMNFAQSLGATHGERVAKEWHRVSPDEIEPLLYLMDKAEKRNAFPTALSYLEKAERIDAVNPVVRAARLRVMAAGAMRQLQQKKPHLAAQRLGALEKLPQSRQGDRPAFLAVLRNLICLMSGDAAGAAAARAEAETSVGGMAAALLIFGIAQSVKREVPGDLPRVKTLGGQERKQIPACLARVMRLTEELGMNKFPLPVEYLDEAEKQFPAVAEKLDAEQIRYIGKIGMATGHTRMAWAASTEGLKRGGATEAHFLLLRARALPSGDGMRYVALAAAAAELGRFHRDMNVVDQAVEIVRNPMGGDSISLTADQAREVIRRELKYPAFPGGWQSGPNYRDLIQVPPPPIFAGLLDEVDDDDDDDDEEEDDEFDRKEFQRIFDQNVPPGLPREVKEALFEMMREAFRAGVSPDEIIEQLMDEEGGGNKGRRTGKRKRR
jgi:tetratricopeptide (TPR) repeat protein